MKRPATGQNEPIFICGNPIDRAGNFAGELGSALGRVPGGVSVRIMNMSDIAHIVRHEFSAATDIAVANVMTDADVITLASRGVLRALDDIIPARERRTLHPAASLLTLNGSLYALPRNIACGIFYGRRDILDRYGFDLPRTWDELIRCAKEILPREKKRLSGIALRGRNGWGRTFLELYWSNGGALRDADDAVVFDRGCAEAVLSFLCDLVYTHRLMPRSFVTRELWKTPDDITAGTVLFAQGSSDLLPVLAKRYGRSFPDRYKIGLMPIGPAGTAAASYPEGSCFVIPASTKHRAAASAIIRFFTDRSRSALFDARWMHPFSRFSLSFVDIEGFPRHIKRGYQLFSDARWPRHDLPVTSSVHAAIERVVIACLTKASTVAAGADRLSRELAPLLARSRYSDAIQRAVDHIGQNDAASTVAELARVAGLTDAHFSRRFTRETGRSPGRSITAMRIRRAERALADGGSAAAAARAAGYTDMKYFFRAFKRETGMTPAAWRDARSAKA